MAKETDIPFDFAAWRARMNWSKDEAQKALGISRTYYWQIEKAGAGTRIAAWAAYGLEAYKAQQRHEP